MAVKMSQKSLNDIKIFVANLLIEIQDDHSKLMNSLQAEVGKTAEFDTVSKVLKQIFEAKVNLLEKIYKELD